MEGEDVGAIKLSANDPGNQAEILYQSANYLAVNKQFDLKINSNEKEERTVEQQLRQMRPELVDHTCFHAFR